MSSAAKNLVTGLLAINSSERLTADLAASHQWLTQYDAPIPFTLPGMHQTRSDASPDATPNGSGDACSLGGGGSTVGDAGAGGGGGRRMAGAPHISVEDCSEALKSPAVLLEEQGPVGLLKRKRSLCLVTETLNAVQRPLRLVR